MTGMRTSAGTVARPQSQIAAEDSRAEGDAAFNELLRWQLHGIAVFPAPYGQKGSRIKGWSNAVGAGVSPEDAWELTRREITRTSGRTNLAIRLGATAYGSRFLTDIDLDGHDGIDPSTALSMLRDLLPDGVAVLETSRGYHVLFWSLVEVPTGVLSTYGAEIFGNGGHLAMVPPSRHPTGVAYQWINPPGNELPVVDLVALDLWPEPKPGDSDRARKRGNGPRRTGTPTPTSASNQEAFRILMAEAGVRPERGGDELLLCPWHHEDTDSLHVNWDAAVFHCFSSECDAGGGVRQLQSLLGRHLLPPTYDPLRGDPDRRGLQLGGSGVVAERDRLADGVEALGDHTRAEKIRACRETWSPADPTLEDLEAFACPNGDSAPVRTTTRSCDDPQDPNCMPWRLAADWRAHWKGAKPPTNMTIAVLTATTTSINLTDRTYLRQVRSGFRDYRRHREIDGGFYGLTTHREGDQWRARLTIAVPDPDAGRLTDGRAFSVEIIRAAATSEDLIRCWQQAYLDEAAAWQGLEELEAFRALTAGRRKFQGFGKHFGAASDASPDESESAAPTPLHRISGGSGGASRRPPTCPRCGEQLKPMGRFDPEQMEMVVAADGLPEWRWRKRGGV